MAKKRIPEAVAGEVERLLNMLSKKSKRELKAREPWHVADPTFSSVGEEEQEIERAIRRANKMLAKYISEPTPARATKAAKLMLMANMLRLFSKMTTDAFDKRAVPSGAFPFQIPGLF
jgi:transposase-like protein